MARNSEPFPRQAPTDGPSITFPNGDRRHPHRLEALLNVFEEVLRHSLIPGVIGMQAVRTQQVVGDAAKGVVQVDERNACPFGRNHHSNEIVCRRNILGRVGAAGACALR